MLTITESRKNLQDCIEYLNECQMEIHQSKNWKNWLINWNCAETLAYQIQNDYPNDNNLTYLLHKDGSIDSGKNVKSFYGAMLDEAQGNPIKADRITTGLGKAKHNNILYVFDFRKPEEVNEVTQDLLDELFNSFKVNLAWLKDSLLYKNEN